MDEIAPGIWRWTARHPEWHTRVEWGHEVASLRPGRGRSVLVDPLLPPPGAPRRDEVDCALERLAREASRLDIMITIPYHARSAEELLSALPRRAARPHLGASRRRQAVRRPRDDLQEIVPGGPVGDGAPPCRSASRGASRRPSTSPRIGRWPSATP